MEGTRHLGFVLAAYGLTAVVLLGVIAATIADYRAQRRAVDALDRTGGLRRPGGGT